MATGVGGRRSLPEPEDGRPLVQAGVLGVCDTLKLDRAVNFVGA